MGVYIKGMEMPEGRPVCIVIDAAGQARRYDLNNDRYADNKLFEAVPVPPHGRLGDLDEIERYKERLVVDADKIKKEIRYVVDTKYIKDAPTIIPAEEAQDAGDGP